MPSTHVRFRIGASLDRSLDTVLKSAESRARRSARKIAREFRQTGKAVATGAGAGRSTDRAHERTAARAARAHRAGAFDAAKHWEQAHRRALGSMERDHARHAQRMGRAQQREMARAYRAQERDARSFARRTSHRTTRFFWPNAPITSIGRRVGGDILRGTGVETHLGGIVGNIASAEKTATALSVQAYQKGATGPAGKRVDPGLLTREARTLGEELAIDPTEILEGQRRFVAQRGNLDAARRLSGGLGQVARSQGANFSDVMFAGAKIESALSSQKEYQGAENQEKLYRTITDLVKLQVAQGKIGSVEMADMVKQLPKLSGIATSFGGDATSNIAQLQTVMQLAERGPAKNAATAATYTQALALDLTKQSAKFEKAGIDVFDQSGRKRQIKDIVIDLLSQTEGDKRVGGRVLNQEQQIQRIMPNKRAALALQEFINVFRGAGGGAEGIKAVEAEFEKFAKTIGDKQLAEDLAQVMKTTEAKAKKFNAQVERIVATAAEKLIPALEKLEEPALEFAKMLGDVTTWVAENPKKAIGGALAISVARAGIETVLRSAIERAVMGMRPVPIPPGGGGPVPVPPAGGGFRGRRRRGGPPVAPTPGPGIGVGTAAALAVGGAYLAGDQANKLGKMAGARTSGWGLLPGFTKKGEFSTDELLEDLVPGLGVHKRVTRAVQYADDIAHSDDRLNSEARKRRVDEDTRQTNSARALVRQTSMLGTDALVKALEAGKSGGSAKDIASLERELSAVNNRLDDLVSAFNRGINVNNLDEIKLNSGPRPDRGDED